MSARERLQAAADRAAPQDRGREIGRERARLAAEAWTRHKGRNAAGVATVGTRAGEARIGAIDLSADGEAVEVWTGPKAGPPQFRIINPPVLVADPSGEVEVVEHQPGGRTTVRRYREDPVAGVAEAIAGGGSEQ